MHHAVDIGGDADEQAELGDVADLAGNGAADRVLVLELLPGVLLHLLEPERDAPLAAVHVQHQHVHFLAGGNDLAGMHVLLGPAHLADVHQTLDARLQLHESAVVGDVGHAPGEPRASRILRGHALPRVGLELLHAQADALGVAVEADHLHLHLLADLQRLARMVDAPPGDVRHVQQPIDAAQIHERAVIGDVLHHAVEHHAFLQALDQLAALLGPRFLQHGPAADDDVAPRPVHLQNLERLRRPHQRPHVPNRADIDLAARQKRHRPAKINGEPALDPAIDRAVHPLLRLERPLEVGPRLLAPGLLAAQHDAAVAVLVALNEQFDVVARLDLRRLSGSAEFLQRDTSLALQPDIDDRVLVG